MYQAHLTSETDTTKGLNTDHHLPRLGFGVAIAPPAMTNLNVNKVNEDLLDELLDQLETDAKEHVHKMTEKYCRMRFLSVRSISIFNALYSSLPYTLSSVPLD